MLNFKNRSFTIFGCESSPISCNVCRIKYVTTPFVSQSSNKAQLEQAKPSKTDEAAFAVSSFSSWWNMSSECSGYCIVSLENNADVPCLKASADTGDDCSYSAIAPSINQKSNQDNSLTQVRGHEIILLFVVAMMSSIEHCRTFRSIIINT